MFRRESGTDAIFLKHLGKLQCFEEDINIPLIVRGPNVGKNQTTNLTTGNVDIAPTMLQLAGYGTDLTFDEVKLDGTPISFPLETPEDFRRNSAARGET